MHYIIYKIGSTGPPKIQIYKNAIPKNVIRNEEGFGVFKEMHGWIGIIKIMKKVLGGMAISSTVNFNGFIMYGMFLYMLVAGMKLKIILLDLKRPESWASMIEMHRVVFSSFYTPALIAFSNSASFRAADLSKVTVIQVGGSYFSKESHKRIISMFEKYHPKNPPPYIKISKSSLL